MRLPFICGALKLEMIKMIAVDLEIWPKYVSSYHIVSRQELKR
jgi:hypothetical protein